MKKLLKILVVLLVLAAIAVGVKFFFFRNSAASEVGVPVSAPVTKLTLSTVISATGTLEPVDQVEVGTQVSGDIAEIFVDFNSKVKKGQVIAELDKSKLQSTLNQAEIALHSAERSRVARTKPLSTRPTPTREFWHCHCPTAPAPLTWNRPNTT